VGTQHDSKPALDLSVGELVGFESLTLLTHASQHGLRRSKVQDRTRPDRQEVVSSSSDRNYAGRTMRSLSDDLLRGAGAIAKHCFGKNTKETRRKIYNQRKRLPIWSDGDGPYAPLLSRKSLLDRHYAGPKGPGLSPSL